ncbi:MAG: hypothetical protein VW576_02830 [Opitutae bacterium]
MSKLSVSLNVLALVISLVAFVLTQITVSDHQSKMHKIATLEQARMDAGKKLEEQKKETVSKLLRQKSRNQDLAEEILEYRSTSEEVAEKLALTKTEISEIENSIDGISDQLATSVDRLKEAGEELTQQQAEIQNLRKEIPGIEQQIETKNFEIRDFENRSDDLSVRLRVFSSITSVLRQHYLDTVSAIRSYARERPWLEPGEALSIQLGPIDLASGYIALSKGGEIGLRENMVFAIRAAGEEISQIRIKKVFRTYSLAEVIPLVGNPLKLQSVKEVDLVAL